jgi:hypothetical protein
MWCAFSRLIITKQAGASLAMDLSHSRPHKVFDVAPIRPFEKFISAVERVLQNCIDARAPQRGPATVVRKGDARRLPIAGSSVDLVVTSPPYLNAIDYMRCSKFSLIWMGFTIRRLRKMRARSIGTESAGVPRDKWQELISKLDIKPSLSARHKRMLTRYIVDMSSALHETARILSDGGHAIYVVGENTIRGSFIPTAEIIRLLAREAGLRLRARVCRDLPATRRYLPPPTSRHQTESLNGRMGREVVLTFSKSSLA